MRQLLLRRWVGLVLAIFAVGALTACDQVDLDGAQPTSSISLDQTISSQSGFEGLLVSMYDRLQNANRYGQQYMLYPDALADNVSLRPGATSNRYPPVVSNQRFTHLGGYGAWYSTINEANNIIADIGDLELQAQNPQAIRDRIRGEALFLRGLAYFDLVRIYSYIPGKEVDGWTAGVPLREEPTRSPSDADNRARDSNQAVYDEAISDLQEAASLLEGNPDAPAPPHRATAAAAHALLSRVHLYLSNWSEAASEASTAISLSSRSVVDSREGGFEAAWMQSSYPGSIFELSMTQGTDGAATNSNQALQSLTDGTGGGFFSYEVLPSPEVRAIFSADDARQSLFATDPMGNVYLEKYTGTIAQFTDRIPVLRMAELYLNRAEARAEQGNNSEARSDLNYIRVRRGLDEISPTVSGDALVDSILVERRREFLFEGKRFFDLKRRQRDIPKPNLQQNIDYENYRILAPLPTGEVQSNPAIEQNPGY